MRSGSRFGCGSNTYNSIKKSLINWLANCWDFKGIITLSTAFYRWNYTFRFLCEILQKPLKYLDIEQSSKLRYFDNRAEEILINT